VGLGGIFDSTNVIDAPEVAVITNIGLEHTEYLGNTLAEIAGNKCGIIKSGADVVCYENVPEVMDVVRRVCAEKGCPLHIARYSRVQPIEKSLEGQTFRFLDDRDPSAEETAVSPEEPLRLVLLGEYQLHNAATALTIVEVLRGRGWKIPREAVRQGLARVQWPARFEVLSMHPLFILDGGHNPQCAEALAESLGEYLPDKGAGQGKKAVFLMGMLADKDYRAVIDIISSFAAGFICLTPDSPRALTAEQLASELSGRGFYAKPCGTAQEGITAALALAEEFSSDNEALPVVSFGSLYMAGAVRTAFRSMKAL
jgi:dihydrofolate synthase/folylpolyglutamate synthase